MFWIVAYGLANLITGIVLGAFIKFWVKKNLGIPKGTYAKIEKEEVE